MDHLFDLGNQLLIVLAAYLCGILSVARGAREWAEQQAQHLLDQYLDYQDQQGTEPARHWFTVTCGQVGCSHAWHWTGTYRDMPACAACGWRPDPGELAALQQLSEEVAQDRAMAP